MSVMDTSRAVTTRRDAGRRHVPLPAALAMLAALFVIALLAPLPDMPNAARARVIDTVSERLPGWRIVRTQTSWEGAWTVVAACGGRHIGFQMVPGHGLPPGYAWLHPADEYARLRLTTISDDSRFLVWYPDPLDDRQLDCRQELARARYERGLAD
jgi:hypothetical protein